MYKVTLDNFSVAIVDAFAAALKVNLRIKSNRVCYMQSLHKAACTELPYIMLKVPHGDGEQHRRKYQHMGHGAQYALLYFIITKISSNTKPNDDSADKSSKTNSDSITAAKR